MGSITWLRLAPIFAVLRVVKTSTNYLDLSYTLIILIVVTHCIKLQESEEKPSAAPSSSSPGNQPKKEEDPDENLCVICLDQKISTVYLECGHMASCVGCSTKVAALISINVIYMRSNDFSLGGELSNMPPPNHSRSQCLPSRKIVASTLIPRIRVEL